ncbi:PCRF domain-containing protein [Leptolyngbya sp. 15MV]|nr:PCRF domain-containing protein [Leptolyngbya sp. 15MV]
MGVIARELSELDPLVEKVQGYRAAERARDEAEAMLGDPELKELAESEYLDLKDRLPKLEREIRLMLAPRDIADERSAILEIRPAAGGDEAALFAAELFGAYQRYAQRQGWRFEILDYDEGDLGGVKGATAGIEGQGVFAKLKFESGVHRVQRVPATESQGRIHTSTVTVAVLPEAEDVDVQVNESDLRVDTYRASGAGGQHVTTKPYIASANYINRMSDYCRGCAFNPKQRHGQDACPFNVLYWNFLITHEARLRSNPRMGPNVLALKHISPEERRIIQQEAQDFLNALEYYSHT